MAAQVYGRKVDHMGEGSRAGPAVPAGAGDGEVTQIFLGCDPVTQLRLPDPADPSVRPAAEAVRYGPGVPVTPSAGQGGLTAERVWRTGRPPAPPRRPHR
jgi:hypothetical protein